MITIYDCSFTTARIKGVGVVPARRVRQNELCDTAPPRVPADFWSPARRCALYVILCIFDAHAAKTKITSYMWYNCRRRRTSIYISILASQMKRYEKEPNTGRM